MIELTAGVSFVNAPGIGALGRDQEAAGAATAAPAPTAALAPIAHTVLATVTAVASLRVGRLNNICNLAFF
ncbi:MAG TPA: hypothetical protein VNF47_22985 [Streptosporangiaceae bacterium]|nr:hypothetical protein [Streptosporangiaceae bacterium]